MDFRDEAVVRQACVRGDFCPDLGSDPGLDLGDSGLVVAGLRRARRLLGGRAAVYVPSPRRDRKEDSVLDSCFSLKREIPHS
jgi:hypothetical protein